MRVCFYVVTANSLPTLLEKIFNKIRMYVSICFSFRASCSSEDHQRMNADFQFFFFLNDFLNALWIQSRSPLSVHTGTVTYVTVLEWLRIAYSTGTGKWPWLLLRKRFPWSTRLTTVTHPFSEGILRNNWLYRIWISKI